MITLEARPEQEPGNIRDESAPPAPLQPPAGQVLLIIKRVSCLSLSLSLSLTVARPDLFCPSVSCCFVAVALRYSAQGGNLFSSSSPKRETYKLKIKNETPEEEKSPTIVTVGR
jgi:hypothetical protein